MIQLRYGSHTYARRRIASFCVTALPGIDTRVTYTYTDRRLASYWYTIDAFDLQTDIE